MEENEQIEFKKTTGELNEAMRSVSAILNKHGKGTIYFGLKNNGTPSLFQITDSTMRDVSRKVFESIRPQIFPTIEKIKIDGIDVIEMDFSGNNQPYSAFNIYYIRIADEDRELSPEELRKIMIGKEYEENWDTRLTDETIDDVDEKTIQNFVSRGIKCGRIPQQDYTNEELLSRLSLCSNRKLNNAGRILFSKNHPITLKLAVFATEVKETFIDMQTLEGNLFELVPKAINYIVSNMRWRVEISEDHQHRKEIPELPVNAMREAVINSFAHARYDLNIFHEIDIFSNRISITNPGSFASDYLPEDFVNNSIGSDLRNRLIAKTLYLCQDVESFGTGVRNIYSLCREYKVPLDYNNRENTFTFNFYRKDRNEISEGLGLSTNEKKVLEILSSNPSSTAKQIGQSLGKSSRTIQRITESLRQKGLIVRQGNQKDGYWKVMK